MAARAATPIWYAPLYGIGCGLLVAGGGGDGTKEANGGTGGSPIPPGASALNH